MSSKGIILFKDVEGLLKTQETNPWHSLSLTSSWEDLKGQNFWSTSGA